MVPFDPKLPIILLLIAVVLLLVLVPMYSLFLHDSINSTW